MSSKPSESPNGTRDKGRLAAWQPYRWGLVAMALLVSATLFGFSKFVQWVEARPGVVLEDPILALLPAIDLTWSTFAIIYGSLIAALVALPLHPRRLMVALLSYVVLILVRIAAMWTVPLDPPSDMIVLVDPVAGVGPGGALTRDLFFSGHVATLFLIYLVLPGGKLKRTILTLVPILAAMLLMQHVHYTVDVLAAPFFAYGCYVVAKRIFVSVEPIFGMSRPR